MKRKADELWNPVRKNIIVKNQSQIQVPSSHPSSFSLLSVPSSSSHNFWILILIQLHDVFPSFRGEDVLINFLSHLKKEFKRKGTTPFLTMRSGEENPSVPNS
ncbi:unnamed protein product [Brassica oleracea var. botrytis]